MPRRSRSPFERVAWRRRDLIAAGKGQTRKGRERRAEEARRVVAGIFGRRGK